MCQGRVAGTYRADFRNLCKVTSDVEISITNADAIHASSFFLSRVFPKKPFLDELRLDGGPL
jgi:hypothetical protein